MIAQCIVKAATHKSEYLLCSLIHKEKKFSCSTRKCLKQKSCFECDK